MEKKSKLKGGKRNDKEADFFDSVLLVRLGIGRCECRLY